MQGGAGNDSYIYRTGDGNDIIDEQGSGDWNDAIYLSQDLLIENIRFLRVNNDLNIYLSTGETLTVANQYDGTANRIETLWYGPRETWGRADWWGIQQSWGIGWGLNFTGTATDETVLGTDDGDVLDGRGGNDVLTGGTGGDEYDFGFGDGQDRIKDNGTADDWDRISIKSGVTDPDLRFTRSDDDLIITFGNGADVMTVENQFLDPLNRIEYLSIIDGFWWDLTKGLTFTGTAQSETVFATVNDDTLDGRGGDDLLLGGTGNDT
ncbi:hypothetical protein WCLP8_3200001 [uncultured Gammaproteobacteria bacterium]